MDLILYLLEQLTPYGTYSYGVMFFILIACGFGLPMPEDVILVSGGILASHHVTDFNTTIIVCMLGVLLGDGVVFFLGRLGGPKIKSWAIFRRVFNEKRELMIRSWFDKHGEKVVFFARFAPGLRMPLYLSSGIYRVAPWKFFVLDGFAAIISVPLWIWIGRAFGNHLEVLEEKVHQLQMGIYGVIGLVLIVVLAFIFLKKRFMRMQAS